MLIATCLFLFHLLFGGGGFPIETLFTGIEDALEHAIGDEDRRSELVELSDDLADYLTENEQAWNDQVDKLLEIQVDHGSNPLDFDAAASHLEQILERRHRRVLETRAAMKSLMSEKEWEEVFSSK